MNISVFNIGHILFIPQPYSPGSKMTCVLTEILGNASRDCMGTKTLRFILVHDLGAIEISFNEIVRFKSIVG